MSVLVLVLRETMSRVTQRAKSAEAVKGREIYGYMYECELHL